MGISADKKNNNSYQGLFPNDAVKASIYRCKPNCSRQLVGKKQVNTCVAHFHGKPVCSSVASALMAGVSLQLRASPLGTCHLSEGGTVKSCFPKSRALLLQSGRSRGEVGLLEVRTPLRRQEERCPARSRWALLFPVLPGGLIFLEKRAKTHVQH